MLRPQFQSNGPWEGGGWHYGNAVESLFSLLPDGCRRPCQLHPSQAVSGGEAFQLSSMAITNYWKKGRRGRAWGRYFFGREGGSPPFPRKSRIPQEVRRRRERERERETSSSMFPLPGSVVAKASYPFHLSLPNVVVSFRSPSSLLFSFPFPPLNRKKVCSGKKVEPEGRRGLHCANRVLNFAKASPPLFLLDSRSCSERKGERTPLCLRSKRVEKRSPTQARSEGEIS